MRLFQNSGLYPTYRHSFDKQHDKNPTFNSRLKDFLDDRYNASHILLPVLQGSKDAFFTNGDDDILQNAWARENGLSDKVTLEHILLAQIESHQTEVFYNLDPMRYGSKFLKRLPGCVRSTICWRAAPSPGADFSSYDRVVCNFPSIIDSWIKLGWNAAFLTPAHDPAMDSYASNTDRPIDVLFIGGYSRHHMQRAAVLESVSQLAPEINIIYCTDQSRITRLADSPLGLFPGFSQHRRPRSIRNISKPPVFGLELYNQLSRAKIVLNGAIDMAGKDRGNMRCFESLGCGALMLSDSGQYPEGFIDRKTMMLYQNEKDAADQVRKILQDSDKRTEIAKNGYEMLKQQYSKSVQWTMFQSLL
jgi:hypothetical protein